MEKEKILPSHIVAVGGIVINDRDEILMVKHWRQGWVFPGGMVEVGENLIDGLKREVMEETAWRSKWGRFSACPQTQRNMRVTTG